jgi:hypothetical protein
MGDKGPKYIGKLVEFERRKIDSHGLRGFVLVVSDTLTLLNVLTDEFRLGGFTVIRNVDVTGFSILDRDTHFAHRAVRLMKRKPRARPGVDITDWKTALVSAQHRFPLLALHPEARDPGVCYIGRIARLTEKTVTLHEIDTTAAWDGLGRHRLEDLTRLEFGGGYEDALWRVAEDEGKVPPIGV